MFKISTVFFYLLKFKDEFSNQLRKTYYRTNWYRKSLDSKLPDQFNYFPRSYLLSSFVNQHNNLFKISNINTDDFWSKKLSSKRELSLHNFLWLSLIDRKQEASSVRKIISNWLVYNESYNSKSWGLKTTSKRIISWILNADIILDSKNVNFKNQFIKSIVFQTNHLKKNINLEKNTNTRIQILVAISLMGLIFKEYNNYYEYAVKELEKNLKYFYNNDFFPHTRNINHLFKNLKYLILLKESAIEAHKNIPDYLFQIIEKNLSYLKTLITPESKLPLFNGVNEVSTEKFEDYLVNLNLKIKKVKSPIGDIVILKNKKDAVYIDVGGPPKKIHSNNYQLGPLSFEYFFEGEKIITNCGYGSKISKKVEKLSRLSSAQSTITLNNESVIKKDEIFNYKNSFKIYDTEFINDDTKMICVASHDAYYKKFGCKIKRQIELNKKDGNVYGSDEFIFDSTSENIFYDIRFHLYPEIQVIKTMSGENYLIQLSKNKSLLFSSDKISTKIEEGIYMGKNKILKNLCINLSGRLRDNNVVKWSIKKNL